MALGRHVVFIGQTFHAMFITRRRNMYKIDRLKLRMAAKSFRKK
jgi:hypothetical protein